MTAKTERVPSREQRSWGINVMHSAKPVHRLWPALRTASLITDLTEWQFGFGRLKTSFAHSPRFTYALSRRVMHENERLRFQ